MSTFTYKSVRTSAALASLFYFFRCMEEHQSSRRRKSLWKSKKKVDLRENSSVIFFSGLIYIFWIEPESCHFFRIKFSTITTASLFLQPADIPSLLSKSVICVVEHSERASHDFLAIYTIHTQGSLLFAPCLPKCLCFRHKTQVSRWKAV